MTQRGGSQAPPGPPRRTISIERTFDAPIADVWDLWTTKEGIESWWGPEGFIVTVSRLELVGEMICIFVGPAISRLDDEAGSIRGAMSTLSLIHI